MTEATPAQELRKAAARLRELAEAAKEATHPGHGEWRPWGVIQNTKWETFPEPHVVTQEEADAVPFGLGNAGDIHDGHYVPTGEAFAAHARYAHDDEEDWYESEFFAGPMPEPLARFVAGMHPGVTLAVAGLLEAEAAAADLLANGVMVPKAPIRAALAVAHAFLGTSPELAAGEGR